MGSTASGGGLAMPTALGVLRTSASQSAANATTTPGPSSGLISGVSTAGGGNTGGGGGTGGGATTAGVTAAGGPNATSAAAATGSSPSDTLSGANVGGGSTGEIAGLSINSQATGILSTPGTVAGTALSGTPRYPSVAVVRLRNVGRVEMGAQNYRQSMAFDGQPSVGIAIFQLPGTNALDVADRVKARMEELRRRFPPGVTYDAAYDTTPFIRESVHDVFMTLVEAALLVALVVLVFLQNLAERVDSHGGRAGRHRRQFRRHGGGGLQPQQYLAVWVGAGHLHRRRRRHRGGGERRSAGSTAVLPPARPRTKRIEEVTGPVIAVALVLCRVRALRVHRRHHGPILPPVRRDHLGLDFFSAVNSLTLAPALAAILLRPRHNGRRPDPLTWLLQRSLGWFFRLFNRLFGASTSAYAWIVGRLLRGCVLVLLAYGVLLVLTYTTFKNAPRGFVPEQDQGRIMVAVQLPDSASLERTKDTLAKVEQIAHGIKGVDHTLTIAGYAFALGANGSNFGSLFLTLDPFDQRRSPELKDERILAKFLHECGRQITDGRVVAFRAPPIPGLSVTGGFKLMVEDRGSAGLESARSPNRGSRAGPAKGPLPLGRFHAIPGADARTLY